MQLKQKLFIIKTNLNSNDCLSNCSNNGVCSYANYSLVCKCNHYFTGAQCRTDKRPCSSWPCLYNSQCIQNLTDFSFFCNCSELNYGKYCQEKVDVCKNEKCSGNGYCHEVDKKPKCKCFYLFEGEHCETKSYKKTQIEQVATASVLICIISIVLFWMFSIFLDLSNFYKFCKTGKLARRKEIPIKVSLKAKKFTSSRRLCKAKNKDQSKWRYLLLKCFIFNVIIYQ